jgi:hypothetical protein
MRDLKIDRKTSLSRTDNQANQKALKDSIEDNETQELDVWHSVCEGVLQKKILVEWIDTEQMLADMLTKLLGCSVCKISTQRCA